MRKSTAFYDCAMKRCSLCDASVEGSNLVLHQSTVQHQAQSGMVERAIALLNAHLTLAYNDADPSAVMPIFDDALLRCHNVPSRDAVHQRPHANLLASVDWVGLLLHKWWGALQTKEPKDGEWSPDFQRIHLLSADAPRMRLWRIHYLLGMLKKIGVLKDSLCLQGMASASAHVFNAGSTGFQRSEMVGDNIIKVILVDRLNAVFPKHEGGPSAGRLHLIQQLVDSNAGLLAIYDYLYLDHIIGVQLPNSKSKSDVVEALFGELQMFLWAGEEHRGVEVYLARPDAHSRYRVVLARHALHEITHAILMWRLETTLRRAQSFIEEHTVGKFSLTAGSAAVSHHPVTEDRLDRTAYDILPLITASPRDGPSHVRNPQDAWHYARFKATTRAGPQQEVLRCLLDAPLPCPGEWSRHYAEGALRVRRSQFWKRQEDIPPRSVKGSMSAMRFPAWRADEQARSVRQAKCVEALGYRLHSSEVHTLVFRRLHCLSEGAAHGAEACRPLPDFTPTPQPPQFTTALAPHLVSDCLQLQWVVPRQPLV